MRRFEYLRRAAHSRRDMRGDDADSHVFVLSLAIPTARGTRHLVPRFALLCFLPKGPTRRGRPLPATYDTLRCLRELRLRGRGIHSTAPKPQWHSRRTEHATRKCIVKRPRVPPSARQRARVGFDSPIAGENCEPVVGARWGTGNERDGQCSKFAFGRHDPMVPGFGCLPGASTATPAQIPPLRTLFILVTADMRNRVLVIPESPVQLPTRAAFPRHVSADALRAGVDPVSGGWCVVLRCRPSPRVH